MTQPKFISYLKKLMKEDQSKPGQTHLNDSVNLYGDTILHYAVFHENTELVKFLLENGADKSIKNTVR
ncbi:MAG: ankyrin repeat domain-containing protein [archaeon]|nr:ankyrin repeat domain-containing protein [archaeon]